ncbi:MAG: hypothetical protein U5R48_18105 [Gammaproteobacteria bacterium]|nr:hypothetical protein [Gammaproteobacteria bacterium]
MYRSGFEWGTRNIARFNERMRRSYGGGKRDIWQMDPKFVPSRNWWWPMTLSAGSAAGSLDLKFDRKNIVVVEIRNSAVAQSMERAGQARLSHVRGTVRRRVPATSTGASVALHRTPVLCHGQRPPAGSSIVGRRHRRRCGGSARAIQEGASASEVVERLELVASSMPGAADRRHSKTGVTRCTAPALQRRLFGETLD